MHAGTHVCKNCMCVFVCECSVCVCVGLDNCWKWLAIDMFSRSLFLVLSSQSLHECNFTMVAYAITEGRIHER